jgi:outer membrane receptor protein involved in Fe transport
MIERYGNTGQLLGNPNLVPESGTNADVGANWTRKGERLRLSLDGALFAAGRATSSTSDRPGPTCGQAM